MVNQRRKNQKSENFSDSDVSPMNVNINIQCSIDPTNPDSNGLKCKISRDPVPEEDKEVRGMWDFSPEDEEDEDEIVKDPDHDHGHKKKSVAVKKSKTLSRKSKDEDDADEDESEDEEDSDDESDEDSDDEEILTCVQKSTMKKR